MKSHFTNILSGFVTVVLLIVFQGCVDKNTDEIRYLEDKIFRSHQLEPPYADRAEFIREIMSSYCDSVIAHRIAKRIPDSTTKSEFLQAHVRLTSETRNYRQKLFWLDEMIQYEMIGMQIAARMSDKNTTIPIIRVAPKDYYVGDTLDATILYAAKVDLRDYVRVEHPTPEDGRKFLHHGSFCRPIFFGYETVLKKKGLNQFKFTGFLHVGDTFVTIPMELNIDVK